MRKYHQLLFISSMILLSWFFQSCSEEKECTLQDWVGTYYGIKTFNSGIIVDFTFEIELPKEGLDLPSNTIILDGQYFTVVSCEPESAIFDNGLGFDAVSGKLDEDSVVFTFSSTLSGTCTWSGTKQ